MVAAICGSLRVEKDVEREGLDWNVHGERMEEARLGSVSAMKSSNKRPSETFSDGLLMMNEMIKACFF